MRVYDDAATVNPQGVDLSADRAFSSIVMPPKAISPAFVQMITIRHWRAGPDQHSRSTHNTSLTIRYMG